MQDMHLSHAARPQALPLRMVLRGHLAIARLDHSIKNIFVLPGIVLPLAAAPYLLTRALIPKLILGFLATTLIACSNYVINEVLDAPFDRLHPTKCMRPAAMGIVSITGAYMQWIAMMVIGLVIAWQVSGKFMLTAASLWVMGCVYNIPPLRAKDAPYVDVLIESVNNPIRMLLGWFMVTSVITPPISLLVAYWMIGCYFMALKRFSEYRQIGASRAGAYRNSFKWYTEESLLVSVLFYASLAMLLFGAYMMRYRIELILAFPALALLMTVYFHMAFQPESPVQNPEKLYKQKFLMGTLAATVILMGVLQIVRVPSIEKYFPPTVELKTAAQRPPVN
ncbi:MAG TPA: UbiA family prenyltransferase [Candidatus Acidoferrales bacterium]|jgi:4-hydroxybenzoate polyprenyltransferase|nr:UbiA family prenyltransferase [Candidatus Acidoferrales bacterium]